MKSQYIFPAMLITLQFLAGIGYIPSGDWRMVVYWIAAAVLNIAVTLK